MRRALAALSLLCSLSAGAQSPVWALHGAHNTVYLAESVHLLKSGSATLPAALDRAYAASGTVVMELDLDRLDPATMAGWMRSNGMLPQGTTLRETIGDPLYTRTSAEADRLGLPLQALQHFEPWVVALTLADLEYVKLGYDPDQGVERQIERRAAADMKPVRGLETLDQQLGELEHLTPSEQSRFLELTVGEMHDAERDTADLLTAWRAGDTRKLADLLSSDYRAFPELYRALVTDRNARWMPQIEGFLEDDGDYLVIVGALHLVGPGGLLELARRDGLTVTPVIVPEH